MLESFILNDNNCDNASELYFNRYPERRQAPSLYNEFVRARECSLKPIVCYIINWVFLMRILISLSVFSCIDIFFINKIKYEKFHCIKFIIVFKL